MPWMTMDVHEQRVRFVLAAATGEQSFGRICEQFGISRPTGALWRARYREAGLAGLVERSRRPLRSPLQTDSSLEDQVEVLRRRYPDWGARKLKVMLARQGIDLPRSTIHRILIRRGLVQDEVRNPAATIRFERAQPNELWQMDFKGPKSWPQPVGPLTVLDDHSRYVIALYASGSTTAGPVRDQLESAFWNCGLPDGMLMDHGIPWWHSGAPMGASQISLGLIRQGIRLHWSRLRHPQTRGKVERFHGELDVPGRSGGPQPHRPNNPAKSFSPAAHASIPTHANEFLCEVFQAK